MKATATRRVALDVLTAVGRGELADRALARATAGMPPRDARWVQELVFGTLRFRGRLDYLLERHVRRGLRSLQPVILDVLRLGAYQLLEMESVPAYAAVSQSVELARAVGGRGADRLVNAVLQALGRESPQGLEPDFDADPVAYLTHWGSHPEWLVRRWVARFGASGARALVEANNRRPELYLRVVGRPVAEARAELDAAGIKAEPVPFAPEALRLSPPADASDVLAVVPGVIQDPAAGLVARYAAPPPDGRIVDLCAAPGGKAIAMASESGYVLAADRSETRMRRVQENAGRIAAQGVPIRLGMVVADARRPPVRRADLVLLDAPCTGTGTFRRHPDGKWRVGPEDLAALVRIQAELLDAAATIVAPGGVLVYATCSLEPEENEAQVEAFLARNSAFEYAPAPAGMDPALLDAEDRLVVLPQILEVDGAFAARLRRVA